MTQPSSPKVAFITGGNRGLGYQTALDLGPLDIHVVIGSRDPASGEEAVNKLRLAGVKADYLTFDLANADHHRDAFDYFKTTFGRLDILINNAGFAAGQFGSGTMPTVEETTLDSLRQHFETNFFQQFALTQTLLPLLKAAPAARIVNLSSILGSLTLQATPGSPIYDSKAFAYDASKSALNALTIHLAYDLRNTGIKVNSAHPGWVKTDMGGPHATMELSEGGKTSADLATLPADGPTGQFIHLGKTLPW
jgi:NAD(P)-dependent dehydrogenase (short-subunit alcohol dehydrogenase family)